MRGKELISGQTRKEFRELLVSWTLGKIEAEFSAVGFEADLVFEPRLGGERRCLVEQYYRRIDFTDAGEVDRLLRVYESVLFQTKSDIDLYDQEPTALGQHYEKILWCLGRDGYEFVDGQLKAKAEAGVALRHLSATADTMDAAYLKDQVERLHRAVDHDTELAIGQAKELIETCCKTILAERGEAEAKKLDLNPLVRKTMKVLRLLPENVPDSAKGAETIKRMLQNLATISQGMAELRSLYGTGHGKHGRHRPLPARHARLAVGAATTLATFLFETHAARGPAGAPENAQETN